MCECPDTSNILITKSHYSIYLPTWYILLVCYSIISQFTFIFTHDFSTAALRWSGLHYYYVSYQKVKISSFIFHHSLFTFTLSMLYPIMSTEESHSHLPSITSRFLFLPIGTAIFCSFSCLNWTCSYVLDRSWSVKHVQGLSRGSHLNLHRCGQWRGWRGRHVGMCDESHTKQPRFPSRGCVHMYACTLSTYGTHGLHSWWDRNMGWKHGMETWYGNR